MEVFYSNHIADGKIYLSPEESVHCIKVLRHKVGDEIKVSGGDGNLYRCVLEDTSTKSATVKNFFMVRSSVFISFISLAL